MSISGTHTITQWKLDFLKVPGTPAPAEIILTDPDNGTADIWAYQTDFPLDGIAALSVLLKVYNYGAPKQIAHALMVEALKVTCFVLFSAPEAYGRS